MDKNLENDIDLTNRILKDYKKKHKNTFKMCLFLLILGVIIFLTGFFTIDQMVPENPIFKFWVIISGTWLITIFIIFGIGLLEYSIYKQLFNAFIKGFKAQRDRKEFFDKLEKKIKNSF